MSKILSVKNLRVSLKSDIDLVRGNSFEIFENEIVGIVGESGSGKTMTSMAIMNLLEPKKFQLSGSINFLGSELLELDEKNMCKIRGKDMTMIYQEAQIALNPLIRIGKQMEECIILHEKISKKEIRKKIFKLLEEVQIKDIEECLRKYPYELSGGQLQRIMIAMALLSKPKLLIADEPTTALDVTIQKEIIDLLKKLSKEHRLSILFITHDLGLVAELCDRVLVMKDGRIIEEAETVEFFDNPKEEYSKNLLYSRPMYLNREV